MRNYGHEQINSMNSWVTCNSAMIRDIISNGIGTKYWSVIPWRHYSSERYSIVCVNATWYGYEQINLGVYKEIGNSYI